MIGVGLKDFEEMNLVTPIILKFSLTEKDYEQEVRLSIERLWSLPRAK